MDQWYIARGKVKQGPFSHAQLQAAAGEGTLQATDMVLQAGTPRWRPAGEITGLFPAPAAIPVTAAPMGVPAPQAIPVAVAAPAAPPPSAIPAPSALAAAAGWRLPWLWVGAGAAGLSVLVIVLVVIFSGRSPPPGSSESVAQGAGPAVPSGPEVPSPARPTEGPGAPPPVVKPEEKPPADPEERPPDDPGAGPALGTWSLTIQSAGKRAEATIVFSRRRGARTEGFLDYQPTGTPRAVEIVSCTFDPASRTLRIHGREMYTDAPIGLSPGTFEARLSADGKSLTDVRNLRNTGAAPGTARWLRPTFAAPSIPSAAASVGLSGERARLYQQVSADYVLDGMRVLHANDPVFLPDMERSSDKHVLSLLDVRRRLMKLIDEARSAGSPDRARAVLALQLQLWEYIAKPMPDEDIIPEGIEAGRRMFNSDPIQGMLSRLHQAVYLAYFQAWVLDYNRRAVRADFRARGQSRRIDPQSLAPSFKVDDSGFGAITLRNKTGSDLTNCFVATHMKVDQKKVDGYERASRDKDQAVRVLAGWWGLRLDSAIKADEAIYAYNRLDKGANVFIPEWKKDAAIEVLLARPEAIESVAESVDVWLGCDQGTTSRGLDLAVVKRKVQAGGPRLTFEVYEALIGPYRALAFSPDGKTVASANGNQGITLWDVATGRKGTTLSGWGGAENLCYSPDGKLLAAGNQMGRVALWDVASRMDTAGPGKVQMEHRPPPGSISGSGVWSVAFSPDGKQIASCGADRTIMLWDAASHNNVAVLRGHGRTVRTVAFSPDGKTLASGGEDNAVKLWDVASGKNTATLQGHTLPVTTVTFSPDGKTLVSAGQDSTLRLWALPSGAAGPTLQGNARIGSVAYSPDGKLLATGAEAPGVVLWDAATLRRIATFKQAQAPIAFSSDGKLLVAGARETPKGLGMSRWLIQVWDVPGEEK